MADIPSNMTMDFKTEDDWSSIRANKERKYSLLFFNWVFFYFFKIFFILNFFVDLFEIFSRFFSVDLFGIFSRFSSSIFFEFFLQVFSIFIRRFFLRVIFQFFISIFSEKFYFDCCQSLLLKGKEFPENFSLIIFRTVFTRFNF